MRRIGLAFNPTRPQTVELRERVREWCRANSFDEWSAEAADYDALVRQLPNTDCLIVLGGDGTFLRAARALATVDVPVLGVNSGHVGFLSKVDADGLDGALASLAAGDYTLERRMMLSARFGERSVAALNDAAIVRGAQVRLLNLEVLVDGSHWPRGTDGVVVATPPVRPPIRSVPAADPGPDGAQLVVTPTLPIRRNPLDRGRSQPHRRRARGRRRRLPAQHRRRGITEVGSRSRSSRWGDRCFVEPRGPFWSC
jgi:NAD+ kinase